MLERGLAAVGQQLEGVAEAQAVETPDELDRVACGTAAARHAAPQAFAGRDNEVRGFPVVVERTEADPIRYICASQFRNFSDARV